MPAADEVWRLTNREGADCDLFRRIAEQGHYAGRTQPTGTRQGIYATAPSGVLLASVNTRDAGRMARMLEEALERWEELPRDERLGEEPEGEAGPAGRDRYPADGLVLRVVSRDLPREGGGPSGWKAHAWNQDRAWFTAEEARSLLPEELEVGARGDAPRELVTRLAALHLVDNVRGQVLFFGREHVEDAVLASEVTGVSEGRVSLRLEGTTRTVARGRWPVDGYRDMRAPKEQERGVEARLLGFAEWDVGTARFVAFELVAIGRRWGGTQYNGRGDDLEPAPIGFALVLAEDERRVPPAALWQYGW